MTANRAQLYFAVLLPFVFLQDTLKLAWVAELFKTMWSSLVTRSWADGSCWQTNRLLISHMGVLAGRRNMQHNDFSPTPTLKAKFGTLVGKPSQWVHIDYMKMDRNSEVASSTCGQEATLLWSTRMLEPQSCLFNLPVPLVVSLAIFFFFIEKTHFTYLYYWRLWIHKDDIKFYNSSWHLQTFWAFFSCRLASRWNKMKKRKVDNSEPIYQSQPVMLQP